MRYITFEEQVYRHLIFLKNANLDVADLVIDSEDFIRARAKEESGRGEFAYKTASRRLNNGTTGLITWCRRENGRIETFKTYGYPLAASKTKENFTSIEGMLQPEQACSGRIRKFWEFCSRHGESDYLRRKKVGAYRIRFRENQYGKVAVIPMIDGHKQLRGYQILNSDGSKVFAKGVQCAGLFHPLTKLTDGLPVGIAEGYVTAATCFELTSMPMVAAFTGENIRQVAEVIQQVLPNSPLVIFADNDRHLDVNKGVICAHRAIKKCEERRHVVVPNFNGLPCTRDYSDWNDLVRANGAQEVLKQIHQGLNNALSEKIKQWIASKSYGI